MYAWLDAIAQTGGPRLGGDSARGASESASASAWQALAGGDRRRGLRRRVLAAAFPAVVAALNRAGLGPLGTDLSSAGLRRAALAAVGEVLLRLGVRAPIRRLRPYPPRRPAARRRSRPSGARLPALR